MLLFFDDYLQPKNLRDRSIPPGNIDDKKSWNVIEQEAQLATPTQKKKSQELTLLDDCFHAKKNLRYRLIPGRDSDNRKIVQSE